MGWGTALKWIGGIAGAPFTGGASLIPLAISAGSDIAQSVIAHKAEGKGAKQQQAGFQQAVDAYAPYNQIGQGAASTLAGYLGIPVAEGPMMGGGAIAPPVSKGPAPWLQRMEDQRVKEPQTLSALLAKHMPPASAPSATNTPSRPQTPSAKSRSSYRMEMN